MQPPQRHTGTTDPAKNRAELILTKMPSHNRHHFRHEEKLFCKTRKRHSKRSRHTATESLSFDDADASTLSKHALFAICATGALATKMRDHLDGVSDDDE